MASSLERLAGLSRDGAPAEGEWLTRRSPVAGALRVLLEDAPVTVAVRGGSMLPFVRDGARLDLAPSRFHLPGDILVFADRQGRLVAHRFLGPYLQGGRLRLLLKGDAAPGPDEGVPPAAVVGRLVTAVRMRDRGLAAIEYFRHAARRRGAD